MAPRPTMIGRTPETPEPVGFGEGIGLGFRLENPLVSAWYYEGPSSVQKARQQDGFDVFDKWDAQTEAEKLRRGPFRSQMLDIFNDEAWGMWTTQIDREAKDRARMADAGGWGYFYGGVGAAIDPTIALPGGAIYRGARVGWSAAKTGFSTAKAAAGATAAQEAVLQGTQEARLAPETMFALAGSTILGGVVGAGVGAWASKTWIKQAEKVLANVANGHIAEPSKTFPSLAVRSVEIPSSDASPATVAEGMPSTAAAEPTTIKGTPAVKLTEIKPPAGQPGPFLRTPDHPTISNNERLFAFEANGKKGDIILEEKDGGKAIHIRWIGSVKEDETLSLGPASVRKILSDLRTYFPKAETISGARAGGAKAKDDIWVDTKVKLPTTIEGIPVSREPTGEFKVDVGPAHESKITVREEDFLDLDLPVSAQTPEIQAKLQRAFGDASPDASVRDLVKGFETRLGEAGIPGAKFLDKGTRNYVVFDDSSIKIKAVNDVDVQLANEQAINGGVTDFERFAAAGTGQPFVCCGAGQRSRRVRDGRADWEDLELVELEHLAERDE